MKQGTARTLWLIWGTGLLYFVFNSMSAAQGWPIKLPGIKFETWDRYATSLVATPFGLAGIVVLAVIGASHARASTGSRLARLPLPFGLTDPESPLLHAAQLLAFVLLPLAGIASLFIKSLSGAFCRKVANPGMSACGKDGYVQADQGVFAFVPWREATSTGRFIYQGGPDFWPFWEPLLFCALWAAAIVALAWFAWSVLAGPTAVRQASTNRG